ncbi:MAG TPA: endonuclease domain-containing protein [Bauldia sp.]|nr:endonuclease domain-containing protein [Bauldia sp.]
MGDKKPPVSHRVVGAWARSHARAMRRAMTPSELALWLCLRNRALKGLRFRRQFPIGPFIVDFVCLERRLVVEVDGDHHGYVRNMIADARRTRWLEGQRFKIVRVANFDLGHNLDSVCDAILAAAEQPLPKPPSAV